MSARKQLNLKLAGFPLSQWVNIRSKVASKVVHHVSERAPPRPLSTHQMSCSLSCTLMECRVWRAVIRSVLHHPAGQNGCDDTGDLWIIYQSWRLSRRIKNVALAQMTFSHHHVLITQCHEDPPPLLLYLTALTSGQAIKYEPKNYNLERLQMSCLEHCIKCSQIWFGKKLRLFSFNFTLSLRESDRTPWGYWEVTHFTVQWSHMPFKQ